jgi:hypothetical protein
MSFVGMFNTSNFTTDLAKKSFAGMITRLMPNGTAPLFGLTSMLSSETAVAVEHGYFSKTMLFPELKINDAANIAAGIGVLTVDSTTNVLPGMVMRVNRTGENVLINQVLSSTQVQVTRGVGVTAAAQINDNDYLYQVGNAFEEGSDRPTALNITPVRITNYTQIFRNTWALTDTARATQVIAGETNVAESKQDCAAFHAADIEKALFFGQKSQGTRNGKPFRTMDGLISIVEQYTAQDNVHTAAATTNYTQLEDMLDPVFNQATDPKVANERLLFVGGSAKRVLNNIGRLNGTYQLVDGATSYGLQFSTFKTARGTFRTIEHPLLNTNTEWAKMAVGVDLSTFNVAYLGDRKTRSEEFGQEDGGDSVGGSLTTEMTCLVKNPPANVIIYGLTAAAAG